MHHCLEITINVLTRGVSSKEGSAGESNGYRLVNVSSLEKDLKFSELE